MSEPLLPPPEEVGTGRKQGQESDESANKEQRTDPLPLPPETRKRGHGSEESSNKKLTLTQAVDPARKWEDDERDRAVPPRSEIVEPLEIKRSSQQDPLEETGKQIDARLNAKLESVSVKELTKNIAQNDHTKELKQLENEIKDYWRARFSRQKQQNTHHELVDLLKENLINAQDIKGSEAEKKNKFKALLIFGALGDVLKEKGLVGTNWMKSLAKMGLGLGALGAASTILPRVLGKKSKTKSRKKSTPKKSKKKKKKTPKKSTSKKKRKKRKSSKKKS